MECYLPYELPVAVLGVAIVQTLSPGAAGSLAAAHAPVASPPISRQPSESAEGVEAEGGRKHRRRLSDGKSKGKGVGVARACSNGPRSARVDGRRWRAAHMVRPPMSSRRRGTAEGGGAADPEKARAERRPRKRRTQKRPLQQLQPHHHAAAQSLPAVP